MIHIRETQGIPKSESNSMTPGISPFIGWLVIAGSRQDEEVVASTHEDRGVVSPPIGAADHLDVKITCSFEIGNANREMAGLEGAEPLPSRSDIDSIFS